MLEKLFFVVRVTDMLLCKSELFIELDAWKKFEVDFIEIIVNCYIS